MTCQTRKCASFSHFLHSIVVLDDLFGSMLLLYQGSGLCPVLKQNDPLSLT